MRRVKKSRFFNFFLHLFFCPLQKKSVREVNHFEFWCWGVPLLCQTIGNITLQWTTDRRNDVLGFDKMQMVKIWKYWLWSLFVTKISWTFQVHHQRFVGGDHKPANKIGKVHLRNVANREFATSLNRFERIESIEISEVHQRWRNFRRLVRPCQNSNDCRIVFPKLSRSHQWSHRKLLMWFTFQIPHVGKNWKMLRVEINFSYDKKF